MQAKHYYKQCVKPPPAMRASAHTQEIRSLRTYALQQKPASVQDLAKSMSQSRTHDSRNSSFPSAATSWEIRAKVRNEHHQITHQQDPVGKATRHYTGQTDSPEGINESRTIQHVAEQFLKSNPSQKDQYTNFNEKRVSGLLLGEVGESRHVDNSRCRPHVCC